MGVLSTISSAGDLISSAMQEMQMSNLSATLGSQEAMNNAKNATRLNTAQAMAKSMEQSSDAAKSTASTTGS